MKKDFSIIYFFALILFYSCNQSQNKNSDTNPKETLVTSLGNIKFDTKITNFQFTTKLINKSLYSKNGKADLTKPDPTSGFFLEPLENMNYEDAAGYLLEFSDGFSKQEGILKAEEFTNKIINVNNYKALIVTFVTTNNLNKKSYSTQAIVSNGKNAIIFVAYDLDNGIYSEKFLDTFKSIEF
jgi:hypothetical protein